MKKNDTQATFTITLSRGYVARLSEIDRDLTEMLDPKDPTRVKRIKYSAVRSGDNYYAVRSVPGDNKTKEYLARLIMARMLDRKLVKGEIVSFVSHPANDKELDYTRGNLKLRDPNNLKDGRRS